MMALKVAVACAMCRVQMGPGRVYGPIESRGPPARKACGNHRGRGIGARRGHHSRHGGRGSAGSAPRAIACSAGEVVAAENLGLVEVVGDGSRGEMDKDRWLWGTAAG